jgi:hypothetical protein
MLSAMSTADALRDRLRALAEAATLPVPALEVAPDPKRRIIPARVSREGDDRITVSSTLLEADADEQTWYLASCLGFWASPAPRRRRREFWAAALLLSLGYLVLGGLVLSGALAVPTIVVVAPAALVLLAGSAAMARRARRALDAAGAAVLEAAGYDPDELTRHVFGGRDEPGRIARWFQMEPTPRERIAAAVREH